MVMIRRTLKLQVSAVVKYMLRHQPRRPAKHTKQRKQKEILLVNPRTYDQAGEKVSKSLKLEK
jgi:hypothetical protein